MDSALRERIQGIISQNPIVLFMKGTKTMPQCGFSATVVQLLQELGTDFHDVNVLADPELREGIKEFSNWPTIPQLYVQGEFHGGCDIVREMYGKGELHQLLGVERPEPIVPELKVSDSASAALREARETADAPTLRLEIDGAFRHNLYFDERRGGDVEVQVGELTLVMDAMTSRRANGLSIDYVEGPSGTGFKIDNPNAPAR